MPLFSSEMEILRYFEKISKLLVAHEILFLRTMNEKVEGF